MSEKAKLAEKKKEVENKNKTLAEINRSKAKVSSTFVRSMKKSEKDKRKKERDLAKKNKSKQQEFNLKTETGHMFDKMSKHAQRQNDGVDRGAKERNSRAVDASQKNISDREAEIQ